MRKGALGAGKESPDSDACPGCIRHGSAEVPGSFSGCGESAKGEACAEIPKAFPFWALVSYEPVASPGLCAAHQIPEGHVKHSAWGNHAADEPERDAGRLGASEGQFSQCSKGIVILKKLGEYQKDTFPSFGRGLHVGIDALQCPAQYLAQRE